MPILPIDFQLKDAPVDTAQIVAFLNALDPVANSFLFVAIKDDATKVSRVAITAESLQTLVQTNRQGWNIYVTVNVVSGTSRKIEDVSQVRAIFIDDDGKDVSKPYPLPPSAIIRTSKGKKQVYWFIANEANIDMFAWDGVQQTLVNEYSGDNNAKDRARILRLPGLYNNKKTYTTLQRCDILELSTKRYRWAELVASFPPSQVVTGTGRVIGETLDIKALLEQFISGENYHAAGLALAGWYYNKGITDPNDMIVQLQSLIDIAGDVTDARFHHRRSIDIPASVNWVIKKREEERVAEQAQTWVIPTSPIKRGEFTELPIPGGNMFHLFKWVTSTQRYPNKEIAIFAVEHMVSVFGGGHYHLFGNTTTRKRVLLAEQGSGKNIINRLMSKMAVELSQPDPARSAPYVHNAAAYLGADAHTPTMQHRDMQEHRVRSFIVPEAGHKDDGVGLQQGLAAYQLQVLSEKYDGVSLPKKLAKYVGERASNQLESVYGGVWVYLHESTPRRYLKMLRAEEALDSGNLSRVDLVVASPQINVINREPIVSVPTWVLEFFSALAGCMRIREGVDHNAINEWEEIDSSEITEDLKQLEDAIVQQRNHKSAQDVLTTATLVRKFEKIINTVLVCALADAVLPGGKMSHPIARRHHLEYAIARDNALTDTFRYHAKSGALSNPYEEAAQKFSEAMRNSRSFAAGMYVIYHHYKKQTQVFAITRAYVRRRILQYIQIIADNHGQRLNDATKEFIEYAIDEGLLEQAYKFSHTDADGRNRFTAIPGRYYLNTELLDPIKAKLKNKDKFEAAQHYAKKKYQAISAKK